MRPQQNRYSIIGQLPKRVEHISRTFKEKFNDDDLTKMADEMPKRGSTSEISAE